MKKLIILISLIPFLTGCATLSALSSLMGGSSEMGHGSGNTVNAPIGSDNSGNGVNTGDSTNSDMDDVNSGRDTVANKNDTYYFAESITLSMPAYVWLIIAMMIPSPFTIVMTWFRRRLLGSK